MSDKLLFIILEGPDDKRFFEEVGKLVFQNKYYLIKFWEYSQQKKKVNENFISSINSMNADYICFGDLNKAPCVTSAKNKINNYKFNNIITDDNIIIVVKEIESWYLAGLDKSACMKLGIHRNIVDTNNLAKRYFNTLILKNNSRVNFQLKILKYFSVEIAKQKNKSFKYFIEKYNC